MIFFLTEDLGVECWLDECPLPLTPRLSNVLHLTVFIVASVPPIRIQVLHYPVSLHGNAPRYEGLDVVEACESGPEYPGEIYLCVE